MASSVVLKEKGNYLPGASPIRARDDPLLDPTLDKEGYFRNFHGGD
jgi:hypothetical protein